MNKQIYLFGKQYESLIETVSEQENETIVKLTDGRFFKFPKQAGALLQAIIDGTWIINRQAAVLRLVKEVLVPKGILCEPGQAKLHAKKQPKLSAHFALFPSWLVMSFIKPFSWMFHRPVTLVLVLGILATLGYFVATSIDKLSYEYLMTYTPVELAWILPLSLFSSLFHELGHAAACRKYSSKTGEIGWGFNFIIPVFFANVSNVYLLNRKQKICVALSGVYFQGLFNCILIALIPWQPILEKFVILNLLTMVFNLIPFFRNDGFWLLNDALKKENLLKETIERWKSPKTMQWAHFLYGSTFLLFAGLFVALMTRFAFVRGPEMMNSLWQINYSQYGFDETFRLVLIVSHYIAIAVALYVASKYLLISITKLSIFKLQKA